MIKDVTDANAVLDVVHWLAGTADGFTTPVTDAEAQQALRHVARSASELLHSTNPEDHVEALVAQLARLRASNIAAQAFCQRVDVHRHSNGVLPAWAEAHYQAWKAATRGD